MSLLEKITTGTSPRPPRILLYAAGGTGKSSWAAQAPKALFMPVEDGLDTIQCAKLPHITDYNVFLQCLREVRDEAHDYQTLVIDSLTALQNLVSDGVCKAASAKFLSVAYGGFNRGNDAALQQFRTDVYRLLDEIRAKRNMCIIQLAHDHTETVKYVDGTSDQRVAPRLLPCIRDWVVEWNDVVAYAKIRTMDNASGGKTTVGRNGGEREMYCVGDTKLLAKNRYHIPVGPMPFTWDALMQAISAGAAQRG